ncbi:ATP-binding protein [Dehalogenimonas formicexedens]|nr:ATP-binding protein [Dehalogenimonas formicexedens]
MKIVLIGSIFGLVPFIALNAIPAAVTGAIVLPSDIGLAFLSFIPLSLGYAVVAKQLLDIDIVIRRSFVYAAVTIALTVVLWGAFALVFSRGVASGAFERFLLALGLSTLAVFLLGPTKNLAENIIDKAFYEDRFDYRKTIQNLSTSLSATNDKEVASSLIVEAPVSALNLAGACLFVATENGSFEVGAARGIFSTDSSQKELLGLIVRRNVGKEFPNLGENPNPEIAFVIPLVAADKEVGVLFISGKTSRQEFSGSDFYLIQGLASVAAVSLHGILIAERDISERRRHEQAILNAKQEWESTFDSIPDLICILDANHNIIRVNRAMADKLGLSPAQTIGKKCYELMHNTEAPPINCPGLSVGKGCSPGSEMARCGSVYQINISTLNTDGKSSGRYVHIARDVTAVKNAEAEQKRLKEKAELSSRLAAVGEMAAGIAHEINNPLTGVLGYAELMLSEDLPDELREEVKVIADGSKRVAEIVKRMLTFARQTKPFKTSLSVTELIDNTLELRNYVLRTAGIDVVKKYQADLPWVVADPGQLQQVLLNLIVNAEHAIKKTGHPGVITITAEKTTDHLRVKVSDNGPGIDPELLPKLFQPFFTTKDPGEGTGLGLSISRSIILEHGGTIDIASELGHGATFTIELPLNAESENALFESTNALPQHASSHARVLVVDDEISIQRLLRQSLSDQNHYADIAGNSQQALELLRSNKYDIILMDLRMPGTSGMALYREIISQRPEFEGRVVVITGDALGDDIQTFIDRHRLKVLVKPFDQASIQGMIDRVLFPTQS